jgi:hypothetical protein
MGALLESIDVNEHLIRRLFPNASRSLIAANAGDPELPLEIEAGAKAPPVRSKLERVAGHGALGEGQEEKGDSGRFLVRITSVRRRLIDEDNLSAKYVCDCCRYAGLIPGDGPGQTRIESRQRKAGKEEAEHTIVEIFTIDASETA